MTSTSPVSRVLRAADGEDACTVECAPCELVLRQLDDFDHDVALGTFFSHHPASPDAIHQQDVPAGWTVVDATSG